MLLSSSSFSQQSYFTIGYGGNSMNVDGINAVVMNYNDTRPWLDKQMNTFGYFDGVTLNAGIQARMIWADVDYGFISQKNSASGTDVYGFYNTRELKIRNGTFALNLGVMPRGEVFATPTGLRMEFGRLVAKTRVFGESNEKDKMEQLGYSELTLKIGPVIKLFAFISDNATVLSGSIYYTWSVFMHNSNPDGCRVEQFKLSFRRWTTIRFQTVHTWVQLKLRHRLFGLNINQ